jgi:hypothetical protein
MSEVRLSFALLELPLIIEDSFAELMDYLGDFRQLVKAESGRNSFLSVSSEGFFKGPLLVNYALSWVKESLDFFIILVRVNSWVCRAYMDLVG